MSAQRPLLPALPSEMIPPPRPEFSTFSFSRIGHAPNLLARMGGGSHSPSIPSVAPHQPLQPMPSMFHQPRAQTPVEFASEDAGIITPDVVETGSCQPQGFQPAGLSPEGQAMQLDSIPEYSKSPPPLNRLALADIWGDVSRVQAEWATVERAPVSPSVTSLLSIPEFGIGLATPVTASTIESAASPNNRGTNVQTKGHTDSHPSHSAHVPKSIHKEDVPLVKQEEPLVLIKKEEEENEGVVDPEPTMEAPSVSSQHPKHLEANAGSLRSLSKDVPSRQDAHLTFDLQQAPNQMKGPVSASDQHQQARTTSPSLIINSLNVNLAPTSTLANNPITGPIEPAATQHSHLPNQPPVVYGQENDNLVSPPPNRPFEATQMNDDHMVTQSSISVPKKGTQPIRPNSVEPTLAVSQLRPPLSSGHLPPNDQAIQVPSAQPNRIHREATNAPPKIAASSRPAVLSRESPTARAQGVPHMHNRNASWDGARAIYERPSRRSPPLLPEVSRRSRSPSRQILLPPLRFTNHSYHNGPPLLQYPPYNQTSLPRGPTPPRRYRSRSPRRSRSPPPRRGHHAPHNIPEPGTPPRHSSRSPPRRPYSPRGASPPRRIYFNSRPRTPTPPAQPLPDYRRRPRTPPPRDPALDNNYRRRSRSPITATIPSGPAYMRKISPNLPYPPAAMEVHKSQAPHVVGRNLSPQPPTAPRGHNGPRPQAKFVRDIPPHHLLRSTGEPQPHTLHNRAILPKGPVHGNPGGLSEGSLPQGTSLPDKPPQARKRTALDREISDAESEGRKVIFERKRTKIESAHDTNGRAINSLHVSQSVTPKPTTSFPHLGLPAEEAGPSQPPALLMRMAGNSSPNFTPRVPVVEQPSSPKAAQASHATQGDALLQRFSVLEGPSSSLAVPGSRSESPSSEPREASGRPSVRSRASKPSNSHAVPLTERINHPPLLNQPSASRASASKAPKRSRLQASTNQGETAPIPAVAQTNNPGVPLAARLNVGESSANLSLIDRLQ